MTLLYMYTCVWTGCDSDISNAVTTVTVVGNFAAEHKLVSKHNLDSNFHKQTLMFISLIIKKNERFNTDWLKVFLWLDDQTAGY